MNSCPKFLVLFIPVIMWMKMVTLFLIPYYQLNKLVSQIMKVGVMSCYYLTVVVIVVIIVVMDGSKV